MYQYVAVHDVENDYKGFELREVPATDAGTGAATSTPTPMAPRSRKAKRKRPMSASATATATPVVFPDSGGLLSRGPKRWKRANSICGLSMLSTSRDCEDGRSVPKFVCFCTALLTFAQLSRRSTSHYWVYSHFCSSATSLRYSSVNEHVFFVIPISTTVYMRICCENH